MSEKTILNSVPFMFLALISYIIISSVFFGDPVEREDPVIYEYITPPDENIIDDNKEDFAVFAKLNTSEECSLTEKQLEYVRFSYEYGLPSDFGYTLAAISIKESNAGKWKVNIQDPSGGLYHVTVDKVLILYGWEDTNFNRNRAMQLLVDDDELAAEIAVSELQKWKDYNSGNWLDTWASYNHGWNGPDSERGKAYAEAIRILIQKIQRCRWV